jgi:hypothetical protein
MLDFARFVQGVVGGFSENGSPLQFTLATGNRLLVWRLIGRHPSDCREIPVIRFMTTIEEPMTDEEFDAEIKMETSHQPTREIHDRNAAKARADEGGARFGRERKPC